jgi:hypothetical protein
MCVSQRWTAQLREANNDLDRWLQARLTAEGGPDEKLRKGLESVDPQMCGLEGTCFGASGWKMLRGLLEEDPERRLSLSAVRSNPALHQALGTTGWGG